jgi:hypothetical protein
MGIDTDPVSSRDINENLYRSENSTNHRRFTIDQALYDALTNPVQTRGPDSGPPPLYTIVPPEVVWLSTYLQSANWIEASSTFTMPTTFTTQDISTLTAQADIYVVDSGFWNDHDVSNSAMNHENEILGLFDQD